MSGKASIALSADGPLIFNTPADIDGTPVEAGSALCRCGQSSNKPYCDGSHKTTGFSDPGTVSATEAGSEPAATRLKLKLATNGPILCSGPLTIASADGSTIHAVARTALCRCGQSSNKPFCDGTHAKVGFTAG